MAEDTNTAKAGAVPAENDKGQESATPTDKKDAGTDSSPEVVLDKDGKPLPWNDQPKWKAARAAEKKLNDLLKANDLDDPDDLLDLVQRGKTVKGKLTDLNALDDIMEKAARLEKYEEYWAKQRRDQADPEERAKIAEQELAQERAKQAREKAAKEHMENTKKALTAYEKDVKNLIEEATIPKAHQSFMQKFFGVGNPANDVDITDKKAIKRLVAEGLKEKEAYDQSVIAEYLESKKGIVKTGQGAESVGGDKPERMNLKNARKALFERMGVRQSG